MYKSIKIISAAGGFAALLLGASAYAETAWKPPAEIGQKAAESSAAPTDAAPAAPAAAPGAAAPQATVDKEKSCAEQAKAKGLKGKAKKQFKAECLKS